LKPLRCESAALEAGDRLQGISMNVFLIRDDGDGPCIVYSRDKIDPKRIGDKIIVFVTPDLNADVKKYLVWTDGAVIESAEFYRYIERGHRE